VTERRYRVTDKLLRKAFLRKKEKEKSHLSFPESGKYKRLTPKYINFISHFIQLFA